MTSRFPAFLFLLLFHLKGSAYQEQRSKEQRTVIAGYLPEYRSYINVNASAQLLTDLILFSIEPKQDGSVTETCCLGFDHYEMARKAKSQSSNLRLWVSVGGAGRSQNFRRIVNDEARRKHFISQLQLLWYVIFFLC